MATDSMHASFLGGRDGLKAPATVSTTSGLIDCNVDTCEDMEGSEDTAVSVGRPLSYVVRFAD